jgi:predicted RND superfamily exporter protein
MSSAPFSAEYPVISNVREFDPQSGSAIERLVFNHRLAVVLLCLAASVVLAGRSSQLAFNASFEKMIPTGHPYVVNYLAHKDDLNGLTNTVRIAVETTEGTIFNAGYFDTLRRINDDVFLIRGVDRPYMKSIWTPAVRWVAVTEEGLDGGPVIPDTYDGSASSLDQVRANIERSGEIGQLVAANFRSALILAPLMARDGVTGQLLDYRQLGRTLEEVRARYESPGIRIHITGFAKVAGDMIEGAGALLSFFMFSVVVAGALLYWHTRCVRSTFVVVACSLIAVTCLLGLLPVLGHPLDPYSMLVPFLIFAIGMSHGAQKMNGIMQDIGRGSHRRIAARYCFRRLFLAGLTALLADVVGFAVLTIIPIEAIQDLALTASIGMAILIVTNLILLPVLLSYVGVSASAARRSIRAETQTEGEIRLSPIARVMLLCVQPRYARVVLLCAALIGMVAFAVSFNLKIGDLNPGAPELRRDSRYNRDNAFMLANYAASTDIMVVMVETPPTRCIEYSTLSRVDALEWQLQQLPDVVSTQSFAGLTKRYAVGLNEGNFKWYELPRTPGILNAIATRAPRDLFNQNCDLLSLYVYLKDHKADTLTRVTDRVESFAGRNDGADARFLLAAGNAGIEAATNVVVRRANLQIAGLVYLAVGLLCLLTFRSWRAVLCAIVPLALTSFLCEAFMVGLGIGVKVATLPVIALGVGIGVDYGIYVLAVLLARRASGMSLADAYRATIHFTGRVVLLTGSTLAIAVGAWAFSPIKFQADMGTLLAFMFVWNLLGALILLPAIATFMLPESRNLNLSTETSK